MAEILIRDVDQRTIDLLRHRAKRFGRSLDDFLSETLKQLALEASGELR
ncbi:FitA-like ribbon-helix-helix domain-containing protein [Bradyrhizobium sp. HKCCYLS2038]